MREIKYVKLRTDMYEDTKSKIIDMKPERDMIHYVWTRFITLAGKVNMDGNLYMSRSIPYTIETLAIEFNRSEDQIKLALEVFLELEMVELIDGRIYRVKNFAKHQNIKTKEKDNAENKEKNLRKEEPLEKDNNIADVKDINENLINNTFENSNNLPREVSLINQTLTGEIHMQDNKTNNSSENENSNKLEDVPGMHEVNLISLENKKDGEKRQNKKKEHTINSDQDENDDIEVCSFYEGEFVLPEGARLIRSYTFD